MKGNRHTVLCVDDEQNVLHSLKRLLRKEGYRLLTAGSGAEGLEVLKQNDVHLVITDQRMPEMSGTEFLAQVKKMYPEIIRIVLTGYTEVDAITESINKGHIYKFILKPWNDQNLKLEIRQGLEQYDLMQSNRNLNQKVVQQNEALRKINENLEELVQKRTVELELQNQALELSHTILEDLPIPIIGISSEKMIVLINSMARRLSFNNGGLEIGKDISELFEKDVKEKIDRVLASGTLETLEKCRLPEAVFDLDFIPLSGRFCGQGIVVALKPVGNR